MLSLISGNLIAGRVMLAMKCSVRGLGRSRFRGGCQNRVGASHCKEGVPGRTRKAVGLRRCASSAQEVISTAMRLCREVISPGLLMHEVSLITGRIVRRYRVTRASSCRRVSLFASCRTGRRRGRQRGRRQRHREDVRRTILRLGGGFKGGTILGKVGLRRKTAAVREGERVNKRGTWV